MMTVTNETKVKNKAPSWLTHGMPVEATVAEVVSAAKQIWKKYHSTKVAAYGGGTQIEIRCTRDGYHGRDLKLVACYEICE